MSRQRLIPGPREHTYNTIDVTVDSAGLIKKIEFNSFVYHLFIKGNDEEANKAYITNFFKDEANKNALYNDFIELINNTRVKPFSKLINIKDWYNFVEITKFI